MPAPTPAPAATATPVPAATATPEAPQTSPPTPVPEIDEREILVLERDLEYGYTIELPENWSEEGGGAYSSDSPWARLTISSQILPDGYTVEQFTRLVQDDLTKDWWPTASLFEINSVEEELTDSQPSRRIQYRMQEAPQYCVLDVEELVVVSQVLPGNPQGFRIKEWLCEHDAPGHSRTRNLILESFRVATRPAEYYRQFISVNGVTVKADGTVEQAALEAGAEVVSALLSGREDLSRCMFRQRAELAIIPKDQTVASLPEYAYLTGTKDFTGRPRDSFEIRGLGGVKGRPVSSAGEEQLLGRLEPRHAYHPFRGLVAVHEFAHAIQNLCFTQEDHEDWGGFYAQALQAGLYPDTHMMANVMEFFAVFSTGYFEVTDELGSVSTRKDLSISFPNVFQSLDEIYRSATLPEKFRTELERPQ